MADTTTTNYALVKPEVGASENTWGAKLSANFDSLDSLLARPQALLGSAAAPAYTFTGDLNTGIWSSGADTLNLSTGGVERVRVDSAGNVGVGVTPSAWVAGRVSIQLGATGASLSSTNFLTPNTTVYSNAFDSGGSNTYVVTAAASAYEQSSGTHVWSTAPSGTAGSTVPFSERARIDSSGNLMVGTTSSGGLNGLSLSPVGTHTQLQFNASSTSNFAAYFRYYGDNVGNISYSNTSTAYSTSSDYRLKENVQPMVGALAKIAQLNPVTYNWKIDGSDGQGFIAHELQAVVPDCVSGAKDAVDDEGAPQYQGVDTSFLVATLVKAIQEQQATIAALEARITALET